MRILGLLDHGTVEIVNFDILAGDRVSNCASVFALWGGGVLVGFHLAIVLGGLLLLLLRVYLGIPLLLVSVQVLHELLNVRYAVLTRVVLARRHNMLLGLHVGDVLLSGT